MSEVNENSGIGGLTAGNTVETLTSTDRDEAAGLAGAFPANTGLVSVVVDGNTNYVSETAPSVSNTDAVEALLDEENTFDVSRAEFNELRDLVLSISHGINQHNVGSPHKIPVVSINSVLGIK